MCAFYVCMCVCVSVCVCIYVPVDLLASPPCVPVRRHSVCWGIRTLRTVAPRPAVILAVVGVLVVQNLLDGTVFLLYCPIQGGSLD